ncbi:hypothetical protein WA026_015666 [Henosepilachna vigintioctopunctata]|uniref:Phospholipase A2 n=1 Tax=Henosepilachna vigintioctopunctata TaxID=420089 RepID=A0AAW1VEG2_9CUCU
MIKILLVIFMCLSDYTNGILSKKTNYEYAHNAKKLTLFPPRVPSRHKLHEERNEQQIYVGFANNPFGASKMQNNVEMSASRNYSVNETISEENRNKRGLINLYNMVSCATGCNPLIYNGYGCYCGFLGSGYVMDGIDRCCKMHDWCYGTTRCPLFLEYFMPYYWMCYNNKPICALVHDEYGGQRSCAGQLCECDRILSECLSRFPCPRSRALCTSSKIS